MFFQYLRVCLQDDAVDIEALKREIFSRALKKDWKDRWAT